MKSSLLFESPSKPEQSVDIVIVGPSIESAPNTSFREPAMSRGNKPLIKKINSLDEGGKKDFGKVALQRLTLQKVAKNLKTSHNGKSRVRTRDLLTRDNMLPSAIPEARILHYGVCQATTASVWNDATSTERDLLPSLNATRKSCPNRPIIFIGYGFGGIFMEEALIAATDKELLPIWKSIAGIVFLSTPFSCSDDAQSFLIRQLQKPSGVPFPSIKFKDVWYDPKLLKDIQLKFVTQVDEAKVPVVCFYEENPTDIKPEKSQSEVRPIHERNHYL